MKSLFSLFLLITLATSNLHSAESATDIVLRGLLDAGDSQVFSLTTSDGQSSSWTRLGQSFKGYSLDAFDADTKTLTLSKDGEQFTLGIQSTTKTSGPDNEASRLAEATKIMNQMNFSEMIEKTLDVQMESMEKLFRQQMALSNTDSAMIDEQTNKMMKFMADFFKAIDWTPIEEGISQVYADTFSQSELESISSFYNTPAGTAMIEKQPELQQRMNEVMMPTIMDASQKMMQSMMGQ